MTNDKLIKIAVIAALMIGAVFLSSWVIGYLTIYQIVTYAYSRVREATGASPWLVLGFLFALVGPFVWSLKHALSPFSKHKMIAKVALGVYVSGFCFVMFFLTIGPRFSAERKGEEVIVKAEKCFVRTPKGVKIVECDDVDPKTGQKPEPLTPKMAEELERRKENLFPQRVAYRNELELFDTITGEPKVWYAEFDGVLELYDNPGRHPISNEMLRPVTQDIVPRLRREGTQQQTQRFQERYLATGTTKIPGTTNIAVMTVDDRGLPDPQLSQQIAQGLKAMRVSTNTSLFKPAFAIDGVFSKVMNGEVDSIRSLSLSRFADYVLLGRKRTTYGTDQASQQMLGTSVYTAQISVDLRVISAATGAIQRDLSVSERGVGLTSEKAGREALELIHDRLSRMEWNL